ncbi:putative replication initiation protein (plasmid) [Actinacidiphila reveromycinica]|uniref:Putative replication initiation protein n=1 Tax=Actinacidiphila reveromycinica TaxID=659352 RepID=A0A7U3V3C5_9ACTN|nr:helix-turn-helix domain-containing protein [Streptomyces sp. SN-593]BBG20726.1 putative replication initiation protein [Streptomyces sp. SN-593]
MTSPAEVRHEVELTSEMQRQLLLLTAGTPGADWRVLTYYLTAAPIGQTVREVAKDVAEALRLSPGSVSKSVNRLVKTDFLEVAYRVGAVNFYRAGPEVLALATATDDDDQPLATVSHLPMRPAEQ